ncbi:hypothetical protein K7432_006894, partial [Basidiobolus ranarum]
MTNSLPNLLELDDRQLVEKFRTITYPILEASKHSQEHLVSHSVNFYCCCGTVGCAKYLEGDQKIQDRDSQLTLLAELGNAILLKHEAHIQNSVFAIKTAQQQCEEKDIEIREILFMAQQLKSDMEAIEESRDNLYVSTLKMEKTLLAVSEDLEESNFRIRELGLELDEQIQVNEKLRSETVRARRSTAKVDEWKEKAINLQQELDKSRESETACLTRMRTLKESYSELEELYEHLLIKHQELTYERENYEALSWLRDSNEKLREQISYLKFSMLDRSYDEGEENDGIISILKELTEENVRLKSEIAEYCELLTETRNETSTLRAKLEDLNFGHLSTDPLDSVYANLDENCHDLNVSFYHSNTERPEHNELELHCVSAPLTTPCWSELQNRSVRPSTAPTSPEGTFVVRNTMFGELEKYVRKKRRERRRYRSSYSGRNRDSESISNESFTDTSDTQSVYSSENLSEGQLSPDMPPSEVEGIDISLEESNEKFSEQSDHIDSETFVSSVVKDASESHPDETACDANTKVDTLTDDNMNCEHQLSDKPCNLNEELPSTQQKSGQELSPKELNSTEIEEMTTKISEPTIRIQEGFFTPQPKAAKIHSEFGTPLLGGNKDFWLETRTKDDRSNILTTSTQKGVKELKNARIEFKGKHYIRHRVHSDASTQRPLNRLPGTIDKNETSKVHFLRQQRSVNADLGFAKKLEWLSVVPNTEWTSPKGPYAKRSPISPLSLKFASVQTMNLDSQEDVFKTSNSNREAYIKKSHALPKCQLSTPKDALSHVYQIYKYSSTMFDRIRSTEMTHLNRSTRKAFDVNGLSKTSNVMLNNIVQEISNMNKHLESTAPNEQPVDNSRLSNEQAGNMGLNLLTELLQDILKDMATLRMTSNDYTVAYYHLLDQKQKEASKEAGFSPNPPASHSSKPRNTPIYRTKLNPEPLLATHVTPVSGTLISPTSQTRGNSNVCTSQLSSFIKNNSTNTATLESEVWYNRYGIHRENRYQHSASNW